MRIAHISDLHIRNSKYREEYRAAFDDLYEKLEDLEPDLVVNTGDTVHSKLSVSPELFDDVAHHCISISKIAPYWLILGNHDLNLKNPNRTDAISPVIRAIEGRTDYGVRLLTKGWQTGFFPGFKFWPYDIRANENFSPDPADINIGLYHGSVAGCVTDLGHALEDCETQVSRFDAMDYVLMGDIHKRQSFRDGRMQYPGSLIQQNYGEEPVKGFLLWDIRSKDEFSVDFHPIVAPGRFYTVQVPASLDVSGVVVPPGSRIKVMVAGELTPSKRWDLEKRLREGFSPLEVITPDPSAGLSQASLRIDDLVGSRDDLARKFLAEKGCDPTAAEEVLALLRKYEGEINDDLAARGTTWKLRSIAWDNMMNYGEENAIDLTKLGGLVGIFAPNASGKSSIFDILLQALFDRVSKDVPRNIDLVNDNKDSGRMLVSLEGNGREYTIERTIERINYGQRKLPETKQWGKTSLDFSAGDESLNGDSRPETERAIRRVIGSFEDFVLTTMLSQKQISGLPGGADILNCRETDRRKILFRFLDLDSYEGIHNAARDDLRGMMGGLKADRSKLAARAEELLVGREAAERAIDSARAELAAETTLLEGISGELGRVVDAERALRELREAEGSATELERMLRRDERALGDALRSQLGALSERDIHRAARPSDPDITLEDIAVRAGEIDRRLSAEQAQLSAWKTQQRQGERSLGTLEDIPCEGKFPTCRFISDALGFVDQRRSIQSAIDELTAAVAAGETERRSLEDHRVVHRALGDWERRQGELELAFLRAEDRVRDAEATVESRTRLLRAAQERLSAARAAVDLSSEARISELRAEEVRSIATIRERQRSLDGLMRALGVAQANESAAQQELKSHDSLRERTLVHERLVDLCGKNGLPYRVLGVVLPVINAEIAKILGGLVKFSVFFEDDPEEQSVSLFIRYGDYKSRPLSLGSGAEQFIASLAIRAALLNVSSLPKTDILIVDEGFGKLDPEHLEAVNRIFESLRQSFSTIFLVSHVDSMRDIVDHSIDIISRAGYAHVDVT